MDSREVQQKVEALRGELLAELARRGHAAGWGERLNILDVDGEGVRVDFVPLASKRGYYERNTTYSGKVRVDFGEYPHTERVHEPKWGHTAAGLADGVLAARKRQLERRAASAKKYERVRECERQANRLNEGLAEQRFREKDAKLCFSAHLTVEQAERFAALAMELGL